MSYKQMFERIISESKEQDAKEEYKKLLMTFKNGGDKIGATSVTHLLMMSFMTVCATDDINPHELLREMIDEVVKNGGKL